MRAPGDVAALARASLDGAVGSLRLDDAGAPVDPPSADDKTLLEHALCRVMFGLIEDASARATAVMSHVASGGGAKKAATDKKAGATNAANEPSMPRLLDLALTLSETGVVEPACVFNALEQLLETCTIADCEDVFTWVEARRGRLSADALWRRGKLVMLRTCNELQRRLSKTADTVLRGRVLLLLSSLYPLSERSALNLGGNYNAGNVTELDVRDAEGDDAQARAGTQASDANAEAEGVVVDRAFYETFWSLQKFFSNPPAALEPTGGWKTFARALGSVLDNFETHRLDKTSAGRAVTTVTTVTGGGDEHRGAAAANIEGTTAGTKYLTAAPLLHLQLRDPAFRRHFLVQCAVFLGFCTAPCLYKGVDAKGALDAKKRVMEAIRHTPPHGEEFAAAVALALRREEGWVLWKRDNCKDFEREPEAPRAPPPAAPVMRRRPRAGAAAPAVPPEKRVRLGNPELDRLWNLSEDNASALREKRDAAPAAEAYLQNVVDDMDPEAQIEEAYKSKNDKTYVWKALRLIAKADMGAFQRLGAEDMETVVPAMLGVEPPGRPTETDGAEPEGDGEGGPAAMETGGEDASKEATEPEAEEGGEADGEEGEADGEEGEANGEGEADGEEEGEEDE